MTRTGTAHIKDVHLPKIRQIGIVVKDIPKAAAYYSKLLGIGPWFRAKTIEHAPVFRGKPINIDLDIVIAFRGGMEYELIQVRGGDECVYSDLLRRSGGGLHHVGSLVPSYDRVMKRITGAGIGIIQSGVITTKGGAVTRYAYLDTVKECGIISEIIESKLAGLPVPQNRLMMSIGCITGDMERVRSKE